MVSDKTRLLKCSMARFLKIHFLNARSRFKNGYEKVKFIQTLMVSDKTRLLKCSMARFLKVHFLNARSRLKLCMRK